MKCRMLSIDSSTKITACAVFDDGIFQKTEVINLSKENDMDKRFYRMSLSILNVLKTYKPDIVYIEETVVPRNAQTQRFLTKLLGVVYGYCILNQCEFNAIRPTEWRKLAGVDQGGKKREELKSEAICIIQETLDITVCDDEAEAILIGIAVIKKFDIIEEKKRLKEEKHI